MATVQSHVVFLTSSALRVQMVDRRITIASGSLTNVGMVSHIMDVLSIAKSLETRFNILPQLLKELQTAVSCGILQVCEVHQVVASCTEGSVCPHTCVCLAFPCVDVWGRCHCVAAAVSTQRQTASVATLQVRQQVQPIVDAKAAG